MIKLHMFFWEAVFSLLYSIKMDHTSTSHLFLWSEEMGLELWWLTPIFQQYFSYILAVSSIGEGNFYSYEVGSQCITLQRHFYFYEVRLQWIILQRHFYSYEVRLQWIILQRHFYSYEVRLQCIILQRHFYSYEVRLQWVPPSVTLCSLSSK
jgi:hypothetical protein